MIYLVSLTAEYDLLPLRAVRAIEQAVDVVVQSGRAAAFADVERSAARTHTLDDLFERACDFDALYADGARRIIQLAATGDVVFCAIGDLHNNGFARELRETAAVREICGGGATAQALCLARELLDDIGDCDIIDARALIGLPLNTSRALAVTGIDDAYTAAEAKLALAEYYAPDTRAVLVRGGKAALIELYALDREADFADGALLVTPPVALAQKSRYGFYDLVEIMKILRGADGCPWDAEQTHKTLRQYLLEESYEVMDAIDADDVDALYDELGDVLLQVVFHAEIARQHGEFTHLDVTTAVCETMINRHPHIFGAVRADTADEVVVNWEAIKRAEKGGGTVADALRDVPRAMGAMMRACKIQKKAGAAGLDWPDAAGAFEKLREEMDEFRAEMEGGGADGMEDEAGDLLFAAVNVLRKKKINPEVALARACEKFVRRVAHMEAHAERGIAGLDAAQMDALWNNAKKRQ
jgi:tetrapyrrole methylase family protein/MazG family protein